MYKSSVSAGMERVFLVFFLPFFPLTISIFFFLVSSGYCYCVVVTVAGFPFLFFLLSTKGVCGLVFSFFFFSFYSFL
ncbi:hypothetical protein BZA77DRAFT_317698, partial [Pyronema omphalodes]